ncbi:MAG: SH3 domain-containing protein [Caldilineaceae bacterium]|nr:SH3 domain-containing protein [Caldilineaceae bacterium]
MSVWQDVQSTTGAAAIWRRVILGIALTAAVTLLSGCGFLSGPEEPTATPTEVARALVPTWTPTPLVPTDTPVPPTPIPVPTDTPVPAEPAAPTDTPAPQKAQLTVTGGDGINVRQGPGTSYGVVGNVSNGMTFDITGKNPAGDWYQICCVNGEQGWIFGSLTQVTNAELVTVAQNIPAAPPTNTPAPVVVAPPPTDTPVPAPQPPPAADPCAGIGGDGCKFRATGGPKFGGNGGTELKLQFFFIHSGVDGGQPQGSYFIWLEKDGQKLPVSDSVRSIALQRSEGALGPYNYEYKIGSSNLPGGTVAGNYVGWVLDGNGERDSQNFSFTVPDGQGEVWLQLDQG